jgi:hypothetical protein
MRREDLSLYTEKLIRNLNLQRAGYPLSANDLSMEEWLDLGRVKQALPYPEPVILFRAK